MRPVPDEVVRRADQIELVDMSPQALRRRMAHGNIYQPDKMDAALSNYFRPGNLTALRELALLWVADRVDEYLQQYRGEHNIRTTWQARERIVVGLTGGARGPHSHPPRLPDGRQGLRQRDPRRLHRPQRRPDLRLPEGADGPAHPGRGPGRQLPPCHRRRHTRGPPGVRPGRQRHPDRAGLQPPQDLAVRLRARGRRDRRPRVGPRPRRPHRHPRGGRQGPRPAHRPRGPGRPGPDHLGLARRRRRAPPARGGAPHHGGRAPASPTTSCSSSS
ncbi:hypothetical protein SCALM49S_01226 [Streptomyces californicus]